MDGSRLDALAKGLAVGLPRRRLFRIVLGGVGGVLTGTRSAPRSVLAQSCSKDADCPKGGNGDACCGGICTNTTNNRFHCGKCSNYCADQACCASFCHDLNKDLDHCGKCGHACDSIKEDCCAGVCRVTVDDPKNCGACDRGCKASETCCGVRCIDPSNDPKNCGKCGNACKANEICRGSKCVKETSSAGPPSNLDLVAAAVQPTDAVLEGEWEIVRSEWTEDVSSLTSLSPELESIVGAATGIVGAVVVTIASTGADGNVDGLAETVELECKSEEEAQNLLSEFRNATAADVQPLDAATLLGESEGARIAKVAKPDAPDFVQGMPDTPAIEVTYAEGPIFGLVSYAGDDASRAAAIGKGLIDRLTTGKTDGHGLAGQLAFATGVAPVVEIWYSRLSGKSQRRFGDTDDQVASQKATDGGATDFVRATQIIPTTESGTDYHLTTWAGRFKNNDTAQSWLDGLSQRLATQTPDAQLIPIDEADGLGDASTGLLYTLSRADVMVVGVDLYVRVGPDILAVGLSVTAGQMTPGITALFGDARPLGKGAQAVIGAQLAADADPTKTAPRGVAVADVFGDSPLPVVVPASDTAGTTEATTFTACDPECGKRAVQDQIRPYVVWCTPAKACTDAKCSCNLFRRKKKATDDEWFGKQNEKKEYDPDTYTYSCKCGNAKTT